MNKSSLVFIGVSVVRCELERRIVVAAGVVADVDEGDAASSDVVGAVAVGVDAAVDFLIRLCCSLMSRSSRVAPRVFSDDECCC